MAPVGAGHVRPPVRDVAQVDGAGRLVEHERAGDQQVGIGVGVLVAARGGARRPSRMPVAFTKRRNSATVTGCSSIQNRSTVTGCTGASSG